eukprot:TRINITY_DN40457_c0_g1_i1.p1 TRINITY_DN40457_c0_g1~~TRINITY_DN40457_c0_g1_i1.p1  ORF type:complete len:272 (-),score=101.56 TRINITY_DN40457_c0_g1_i1:165-980(-)
MAEMLGLVMTAKRQAEEDCGNATASKLPKGAGKKTGKGGNDTKEEQESQTSAASGRKTAGKKIDKEDMSTLLMQVAQLSLHNDLEVKQVKTLLVHTVIFTKEGGLGDRLVQAAKDTVTTYLATVKALQHKEKQDYSGPHVFVWLELTQVLAQHAKTAEDVISQKAHKHYLEVLDAKAQNLLTDNKAMDTKLAMRKALEAMVHTCRVSKCWNPSKAKVELAMTDPEAVAIMEVMIMQMQKHAEGERKRGAPPKSDLHRKIEKVLRDSRPSSK